MGILDEAIRDHLDLKRKGGAQETDLRRLEDEAFGPPSRPGESAAEAKAPAAEAPVADKGAATMDPPAPAEPREEAEPFAEQGAPEGELSSGGAFHDFAAEEGLVSSSRGAAPPSPVEQEFTADEVEVDAGEPEPADESPQPEPPPSPDPQPEPGPEPPEPSPPTPAAGEPTVEDTQPHDMQAEIGAPESQATPSDEIEISDQDLELDLDEEELDQSTPEESEPGRREGPSDSGGGVEVVEEHVEIVEERVEDVEDDVDREPEDAGEDVLEETPDFLRETPEHDRLWFEQNPPKDFDFDED